MNGPTTRWQVNAVNCMVTLGIVKDWKQFLDNYFPNNLRSQKELKFQQLRRGDMSMIEYAKKFEDMDAYSRKVSYAADYRWKIYQFMFDL